MIELKELRQMVADEVGFNVVPEGYADSGNRVYGACNDSLIEICFDIMNKENK